jgi:hypothetical protein
MARTQVGRPVPDKLTIWPVEAGRFGVDATFVGATGYSRACRHQELLRTAGVRHQFRQGLGDEWTLRLGPVPAADVGTAVDAFVGGGL